MLVNTSTIYSLKKPHNCILTGTAQPYTTTIMETLRNGTW